jgi:hypothetical protein
MMASSNGRLRRPRQPAEALRVHVSWEELEALSRIYRHTDRGATGGLTWDQHEEALGFLKPEEIKLVQAYVQRTGYLPELVPHRTPPKRRLAP